MLVTESFPLVVVDDGSNHDHVRRTDLPNRNPSFDQRCCLEIIDFIYNRTRTSWQQIAHIRDVRSFSYFLIFALHINQQSVVASLRTQLGTSARDDGRALVSPPKRLSRRWCSVG